MKDNRLITLLKTFTLKEMKDFEKFVSSPYFSKGRNLKPLYLVLKKHYPSFDSQSFTKEKIFRKLFPEKKFDEKKSLHALSVIFSELTFLAEKFLAIELLQKENGGTGISYAVLRTLENRNMESYKLKLISGIIENIPKQSKTDFFYEVQIRLNQELAKINFDSNKIQKTAENIRFVQLFIYGYYIEILTWLVNTCAAIESSGIKSVLSKDIINLGLKNFDPDILTRTLYDDGHGTKTGILAKYFMVKAQIDKDDDESYFKAVEYFKSSCNELSWQTKRNYFINLLNICYYRVYIANAKNKYSEIGSELVDFGLKNKIYSYLQHGPLHQNYYIVFFGFKNEVLDTKELKIYTDNIIKLVEGEYRKPLRDFSYAWISFKERDYERTLELTSRVLSSTKWFDNISLKNIMPKLRIISLYSLNYIEEAIYSLNSYKHYVKSRNIDRKHDFSIGKDLKFIDAVRFLITYKTNPDRYIDEITLKKTIDEYGNYNINPWFEEELERLKVR